MVTNYMAGQVLNDCAPGQAPTGTLTAVQQRIERLTRLASDLSDGAEALEERLIGRRDRPPCAAASPKAVPLGAIATLDDALDTLEYFLSNINGATQRVNERI